QERYRTDAYAVTEMLTNLRKGLFSELYSSKNVDAYRRNIQRAYIEQAGGYILALKEEKRNEVVLSDVVALMRGELNQLSVDLAKSSGNKEQLTSYHWEDLAARIDLILKSN
ncbi:MAG: hypothetical protein ACI9L9_001928, partial [Marivirga sp.]